MSAQLSFFPLAVMIARNQAAPILAKIAKPEPKEINYEGRRLNYEEQVDQTEWRREQWRDEP